MNEEKTYINPDFDTTLPPQVSEEYVVEDVTFPVSAEAQAAADAALAEIKNGSFSERNANLGKMINCPFCSKRHRRVDVVYREHFVDGKKTVTLDLVRLECKQNFLQLWIDEDLETGELTIQYATVPLPGQNPKSAKAIVGAAAFAKKRKNRHPNKFGLQLIEHTRRIFNRLPIEKFPEEAGRMMEARRVAVNVISNKRARKIKRIRDEQRTSRRINRGR